MTIWSRVSSSWPKYDAIPSMNHVGMRARSALPIYPSKKSEY
jgi:hypothetical protein